MKLAFGKNKNYGTKNYFDSCLAAACLVQGENKASGSLSIYCQRVRREVSVFRIIGIIRGPVGCLI
jgi:hypothetical protein